MIHQRTSVLIAVLIAAVSLVGVVTPAAFAQNTVTATQSNSFTADVSMSQSAEGDDITQDQGFCLQVNQQNAAAGNDATNTGSNSISADGESTVDCS
jgi:predicted PurR-regulated permease PerM